jgi:hypothetical protein
MPPEHEMEYDPDVYPYLAEKSQAQDADFPVSSNPGKYAGSCANRQGKHTEAERIQRCFVCTAESLRLTLVMQRMHKEEMRIIKRILAGLEVLRAAAADQPRCASLTSRTLHTIKIK